MNTDKITPETEVSTTELACVLGITGRRIRQLAEDGQLEKSGQGRFVLADAVQRYIAGLSRETTSAEEAKLERAKRQSEATLKMSKAEIARLEMKELQGNMHRSEDVVAMTKNLIFTICVALVALSGRVAAEAFEAKLKRKPGRFRSATSPKAIALIQKESPGLLVSGAFSFLGGFSLCHGDVFQNVAGLAVQHLTNLVQSVDGVLFHGPGANRRHRGWSDTRLLGKVFLRHFPDGQHHL